MILSKSCAYGIRAALYLASLASDGFVPIRTISEDLHISFSFLTKIFQKLTLAGLMHSLRGPNGGVAFTRPLDAIALIEIITAIDGPELFQACVLGLPGCGQLRPCPLHDAWMIERERLRALFTHTTLADMNGKLDVRLTEEDP